MSCQLAAMSHSHSHGPGDGHSHSHSHSHPHSPSSPQTPAFPAPDPKLQTLIEQDFQPLLVGLSADKNTAVCANHGLEKCDSCDVDFVLLNRLSNALLQHPTLLCPPPGNVITPKITQLVTVTKEEGNVCSTSFIRSHVNLFIYTSCLFLSLAEPIQISTLCRRHNKV